MPLVHPVKCDGTQWTHVKMTTISDVTSALDFIWRIYINDLAWFVVIYIMEQARAEGE